MLQLPQERPYVGRIAGLKEKEKKDKDQRGGKDQTVETDQIRHKKRTQILMKHHIWLTAHRILIDLIGYSILGVHRTSARKGTHS